jgi:S1-C subfamily serine protease
MKAHIEVIDAAVAATCTSTGLTEGKHCSVCSRTLVPQNATPIKEHNVVVDAAREATCSATGLTEGKHCSSCSKVIVAQQEIPKKSHVYNNGEIVSSATCATQGIKKYTCTVAGCNHSYTEVYNLPAYTATEIANQAVKYVGEITIYNKSGSAIGTGTGFVISSDGKIVTNYHVIDEAYYADIVINNTRYNINSVLAYDPDIDLAIVKINATGLISATVCKLPVNVGETVYAIGSSRGLTNTFSQGIVTYANRVVDGVSHVQHDASITHGNSGGPLINIYGEVIGVNTWGVLESQNLNFAVSSVELDNLVYLSRPISLQELYAKGLNAYETLINWLLENYNYTGDGYIDYRYQVPGEKFSIYTLTYYQNTNRLCLVYYHVFDNNDARYVSIELSKESNTCRYYATYTDGDYSYQKNVTQGYINPSLFTRYTPIGYDSLEGDYWTTSSLLSTYQEGIVDSLDWFETLIDVCNFDFSLVDFGYSVYSSTGTTKTAKDIIIGNIVDNGEYDSEYDWYEVQEHYSYSNYRVYYSIYYHVDTGSVTLQKSLFYDSGEYWDTYLNLSPTKNGMYYSCTLKEKNSAGSYDVINNTKGYINPITFTENSALTYTSYEGADNRKSKLLEYYSEDIADLLNWAIYYFDKESLNITFEDLGF